MAKAVKYKYQADPEHYGKMKDYHKARRSKTREQLAAYKSTKCCTLCPENEPVCLEFHHVDPRTKDGSPTNIARDKGWGFDRIIEYLERTCIILCSNCHRKVHKKLSENQHKSPARKTNRKT